MCPSLKKQILEIKRTFYFRLRYLFFSSNDPYFTIKVDNLSQVYQKCKPLDDQGYTKNTLFFDFKRCHMLPPVRKTNKKIRYKFTYKRNDSEPVIYQTTNRAIDIQQQDRDETLFKQEENTLLNAAWMILNLTIEIPVLLWTGFKLFHKVLYRTAMDIAPKLLVTSESGRRR